MKTKTLKFILSTVCILIVALKMIPDNYLLLRIGWYIFGFEMFLLAVHKYAKRLPDRLVYLIIGVGWVIPSILFIIYFASVNYIFSVFALTLLSIFSIYNTIRNWNNMDKELETFK